MTLWAALILGIVEGVTEFLPVSSTGHLTVVERLFGYQTDDQAITAFTAVIQVGAIIAVIIYFRSDIWRLLRAWFRGLAQARHRTDPDYRMAWLVILGSLPIVVAGLAAKRLIEGPLRSIWVVAVALIAFSAVMVAAESVGRKNRGERHLRWPDTLAMGLAQCLALIPGVSRSGATISAGLFRGLDRVAATRLSFLLGIPALVGAGGLELPEALKSGGVGWGATLVGTVASFVVAYASVAWLLRFVGRHSITVFVWYRVAAGTLLIVLLATGVLAAGS